MASLNPAELDNCLNYIGFIYGRKSNVPIPQIVVSAAHIGGWHDYNIENCPDDILFNGLRDMAEILETEIIDIRDQEKNMEHDQ